MIRCNKSKICSPLFELRSGPCRARHGIGTVPFSHLLHELPAQIAIRCNIFHAKFPTRNDGYKQKVKTKGFRQLNHRSHTGLSRRRMNSRSHLSSNYHRLISADLCCLAFPCFARITTFHTKGSAATIIYSERMVHFFRSTSESNAFQICRFISARTASGVLSLGSSRL